MGIVGGAVERIDDPAEPGRIAGPGGPIRPTGSIRTRTCAPCALFADQPVGRKGFPDALGDERLRGPVGIGDQVDGALELDVSGLG